MNSRAALRERPAGIGQAVQAIKKIVKRTPFYYHVIWPIEQRIGSRAWRAGKRVQPPHAVRREALRNYALEFSTPVLVETGTYLGRMIDDVKSDFRRIFSIELDETLCVSARRRFAKFPHISILQGDSAEVLRDILPNIKQPCLFWLDAHFAGNISARGPLETPIMHELALILSRPIDGHVILIDDARLFVGEADYPTLEEVRALVRARCPECVMEVADDVVRIHGRRRAAPPPASQP